MSTSIAWSDPDPILGQIEAEYEYGLAVIWPDGGWRALVKLPQARRTRSFSSLAAAKFWAEKALAARAVS